MGGNALKTETVRFSPIVMNKVRTTLLPEFEKLCVAKIIPYYANKLDFGDVDILLAKSPNLKSHINRWLSQTKCPEWSWNSDVLSFAYHTEIGYIQVDLILVDPTIYDYAYHYFSFNDCGNLVGRVAHKMGVRHGHAGLQYVLRSDDHIIKTFPLTVDHSHALRLLGFDPSRFDAGFDELTDIFQFVSSGKYFTPSLYLLETRNYRDRTRDRKRKTYMSFLEYCRTTVVPTFQHPDKPTWLTYWFDHFPDFKQQYENTLEELAATNARKLLYNGKIVGNLTGLSGKALGEFMQKFKPNLTDEFYAGSDSDRAAKIREAMGDYCGS